jgi:hypothetical protein
MVNSSVAVFSKSGSNLFQMTLDDLWAPVNPPGSPFDPKCAYDHHAGRFILLALARNSNTQQSSYLIAVSRNTDPFGDWWIWNLDASVDGSTPSTNWADYPQLGFDNNAGVYISSNQFSFLGGGDFQYAKLRVLRKSELYWVGFGGSIGWWDFWNWTNQDGSQVFTWQPVLSVSSPNKEYLVNTESRLSGNAITLWELTNPAGTPSLTRKATIGIGSYSVPPDAEQKDGGGLTKIDTGDCRLYNAVYGSNRIYTAFPEAHNWGSGGTEAALRYVVINTNTNTAELDVRFGSDNLYYYYPAIHPDNDGNIYLVFSRSGVSEYAHVRYTGRLTSDTVTQNSALLKAGVSAYQQLDSIGRNRWGDYSGIALDPSSGSVWVAGEWAKASNRWGTWIGELAFVQQCQYTLVDSMGNVWCLNQTASTSSGLFFQGTVDLGGGDIRNCAGTYHYSNDSLSLSADGATPFLYNTRWTGNGSTGIWMNLPPANGTGNVSLTLSSSAPEESQASFDANSENRPGYPAIDSQD